MAENIESVHGGRHGAWSKTMCRSMHNILKARAKSARRAPRMFLDFCFPDGKQLLYVATKINDPNQSFEQLIRVCAASCLSQTRIRRAKV